MKVPQAIGAYLNVVSSLWLEYPLELRTCRLERFCVDFPALRWVYDGFGFLVTPVGELSDDVDVSSCVSVWENCGLAVGQDMKRMRADITYLFGHGISID